MNSLPVRPFISYVYHLSFFTGSNIKKVAAQLQLLGAPDITVAVSISNDTGPTPDQLSGRFGHSFRQYSHLTFHATTLHYYTGRVVCRSLLNIEMQITKTGRTAIKDVSRTLQLLLHLGPTSLLLGNAMQNYLYFAAPPGNTKLYAAVKKHRIAS